MKSLGMLIYFLGGIVALIINLSIINEVLGIIGVILGFFLFPILLVLAPWYALLAWGEWTPLIITYGSFLIATVFFTFGED